MNAQELAELDLAVAKAEGLDEAYIGHDAAGFVRCLRPADRGGNVMYWPSSNPAEAMRLLEKYKVCVDYDDGRETWFAWLSPRVYGETPCITICRAVVALKGAA